MSETVACKRCATAAAAAACIFGLTLCNQLFATAVILRSSLRQAFLSALCSAFHFAPVHARALHADDSTSEGLWSAPSSPTCSGRGEATQNATRYTCDAYFYNCVFFFCAVCLTAAVAASTAHRVLLQSSEKNALVAVDVSQDGLCATKIVFGDAVTV